MDKCQQLAQAISDLFKAGIELDHAALHYIDSTFANPESEDIQAILVDPGHEDRDSLSELVFFPDVSFQLELEDLLESGCYGPDDEILVKRLLLDGHCPVPIGFADGRCEICVPLPPEAVEPLVTRLRITFQSPPRIIAQIENCVPEHRRGQLKVCLRNSRVAFDERHSRLLAALLQALAEDVRLSECVAYALRVFEETEDPGAFYDALADRRHALVRDIRKMRTCDSLLKQDNFETLVMRGVRIPLIDVEDAANQVQLIDKICIALYGATGCTDAIMPASDTIDCRTEEDIKMLIRRLTLS